MGVEVGPPVQKEPDGIGLPGLAGLKQGGVLLATFVCGMDVRTLV